MSGVVHFHTQICECTCWQLQGLSLMLVFCAAGQGFCRWMPAGTPQAPWGEQWRMWPLFWEPLWELTLLMGSQPATFHKPMCHPTTPNFSMLVPYRYSGLQSPHKAASPPSHHFQGRDKRQAVRRMQGQPGYCWPLPFFQAACCICLVVPQYSESHEASLYWIEVLGLQAGCAQIYAASLCCAAGRSRCCDLDHCHLF